MKKILCSFLVLLLSIFLCSFAENEEITPLSSDTFYATLENENDILNELNNNYSDYNIFSEEKLISTKAISNAEPLNVKSIYSNRFNKTEIDVALANSTSISSYGGCGPIAMIGILDYFATYLGYNEIMDNSNDYNTRINLATKVFNTVPTYEIGFDEKSTFTNPLDYVSSFNLLMNEFNLHDTIIAKNDIGIIVDTELDILKESINEGIPVTIYTGFVNSTNFAKHYFVCFGYKEYVLFHKETNERLVKTYLLCHTNGSEDFVYCDADILDETQSGIIYYEIKYNTHTAMASDFKEEFINHDTNQGQYFYDPKTELVSTNSNYIFNTNRLRCSYIEDKYLVLSANRSGVKEAYLEFEVENEIRALEFNMGLWSGKENFNTGDIIRVDYYDSTWKPYLNYDYKTLTVSKDNLKTYKVIFPKGITKFRIYVKCNTLITADRNKGRLVLDNIIFKEKHQHIHEYTYKGINSKTHKGVCECGKEITGRHAILSSETSKRYVLCYYCKYSLDLTKDVVMIIYV